MLGAIAEGLRGVDAGFDRMDRAAAAIAKDGAAGDLAGNMVDMMRARQDVRAGLAVIRTADETIGSLLDILA